ncbi:MAG TPA: tetratricopeptide repeat protein [Polyangia bacterium]|nr:tetratricopeptide repeat protein [Polyangia bacterium]
MASVPSSRKTPAPRSTIVPSARRWIEKGQYDKALGEYQSLVGQDGGDPQIWLRIAEVQVKKGDTQGAVATFEKIAMRWAADGFYMKAVAIYKQILALDPRNFSAHLRLGELYQMLSLLADAKRQLAQAAEIGALLGRQREVMDARRKLLAASPDDVHGRLALADEYLQAGATREATGLLAEAARYLESCGRTDEFVQVAHKLLALEPGRAEVARELGRIYIGRAQPEQALPGLRAAFEADPRDAKTLDLLAIAFEQMGRADKALMVLRQLACVQHEGGLIDLRNQTYQHILRLQPDDQEAQRALGLWPPPRPAAPSPTARARMAPAVDISFTQPIVHTPLDDMALEYDEEIVIGG